MIGIILSTHGPMAQSIQSSMEMIAGAQEGIRSVCFIDGEGTEELSAKLTAAIEELAADQILILCDLAGGSPYNVAAMISGQRTDKEIRVIAGLNLPMLLEAALGRGYQELSELIPAAMAAASEGITLYAAPAARAQAPDDEGI